MLFGAMNFPLRDLEEEIQALAGLGFDFLELAMDAPGGLPENLRRRQGKIVSLLQACGLGLVAHLPTFVWPADLTPRIRKASLEESLDALELASSMGAYLAVVHPGSFFGLGALAKDKSQGLALETLEALSLRAKALGMALGLENMFPRGGWLVTADDFSPILEGLPQLGITLDIGHAYIKGGLGRILEFIERFSTRIVHLHVSDNWGERDDHLPLGAGTVPYPKVVEALRGSGYQGWATFEVFSPDRDYLRISREKFRVLWPA